MRWIDRLCTTFRADAHGVLDNLEDRQLLLRQHLRDAETALAELRARIAGLSEEATQVSELAGRLRQQHARHDEDANLAIAAGQDELAKKALTRALGLRQQLEQLDQRLQTNQRTQAQLESTLTEHETALVSLRERASHHLASCSSPPTQPADLVTTDQVEIELLRRKQNQPGDTNR